MASCFLYRRRTFITLLGGASVAWPVAVRAQQQTMPVVGYLQRPAPIRNDFGSFLDGLRALGYEEGRNIRIERRYGNSDDKRLRELAQELARLNPVVIVVDGLITIGTVQAATTTIPIRFGHHNRPGTFRDHPTQSAGRKPHWTIDVRRRSVCEAS